MDVVAQMTQYIGQIIIAAGGGVAIGLGLFKTFGAKWLDARFDRQMVDLKAKYDAELQHLKTVHDAQVRHIQSTIDREIHRAKKLYDREMDALSSSWNLLCKCYDHAQASGLESYPNLQYTTDEQVSDMLDQQPMRDLDKREILAATPEDRTEKFREWLNERRVTEFSTVRAEFITQLTQNAIFISTDAKAKFQKLDGLIVATLAEYQARTNTPDYRAFDRASDFITHAPALRDELEKLIHGRLWSSNEVRALSPQQAQATSA